MMEAFARVQRVDPHSAWLKVTDAGGGCGRCNEPGGCRAVQITQAFGLPRDEFSLPLRDGVEAGDRVRITIPDGAPLEAALASYGLAAVLLLLGAVLGAMLGGDAGADLHAAGGGAAGLILAVLVNRVLTRSRNWRARLKMELVSEPSCTRSASEAR
jgi:sigma-E factor negative regulatory protein RseC